MNITPEELKKLIQQASEKDLDEVELMMEEIDLESVPEPSKSMSTDQYARSREEEMLERMPLEEVELEKIEDEEDEEDSVGLDIIMYSDSMDEEAEEESSSEYYVGDELESQMDIIKELENSIGAGKNEEDNKWYPHVIDDDETIVAYGHKITAEEEAAGTYDDGITEEEAIELLKIDIDDANKKVRAKIEDFDSFPFYLKMELVNSAYRGLIQASPNTLKLINKGDFEGAADEFTKNVDAYLDEDSGIRPRMDRVVDALKKYAQELDD